VIEREGRKFKGERLAPLEGGTVRGTEGNGSINEGCVNQFSGKKKGAKAPFRKKGNKGL